MALLRNFKGIVHPKKCVHLLILENLKTIVDSLFNMKRTKVKEHQKKLKAA